MLPITRAVYFSMTDQTNKGHSEDYFSDYRDHWWNNDFLELMARRWELGSYSTLLDVGCGEFHWSRLLAPFMMSPEITGLDSDAKWSAKDIANYEPHFPDAASLKLIPGSAESIPFPDNSFDVATCQTVLIHCADPAKAVAEMKRVVRPGGIVICAEPNNLAPHLTVNSLESIDNVQEMLDSAKIYAFEQYGKYLSGEGNNSIGDLVPLFFQTAGLENIKTYLSDKCVTLIPPYITVQEKDTIRSIEEWSTSDAGPFDTAEKKAFVDRAEKSLGAIGIDIDASVEKHKSRVKEGLEDGTFYSPGLSVMYLVSGKKG